MYPGPHTDKKIKKSSCRHEDLKNRSQTGMVSPLCENSNALNMHLVKFTLTVTDL